MTNVPLAVEVPLLSVLAVGLFALFLLARRLRPGNRRYQAGLAVGMAAALLLFWVNGAVGIIGASNNDANLMYLGVLLVAAFGPWPRDSGRPAWPAQWLRPRQFS